MSNIVNVLPEPNINHPVDFSWYPNTGFTTSNIQSGTIGEFNFPYGLTTLSSNLTTTSGPFSISVQNASTFIGGSGTNFAETSFSMATGKYPYPIAKLYIFNNVTNWALIGYTYGPTGQAPITYHSGGTPYYTFNYCFILNGYNGGTGLNFNTGTTIYDPRWVSYFLPLSTFESTKVVFDAIDNLNIGLPSSKNANIISYHWNFGNGIEADGPVVETQYWYTGQLNIPNLSIAAPTQVTVTLTAIDISGQVYYVSHPIIFGTIYGSIGSGSLNEPIAPV